jgi:hypothetical protein
MSRFTQQEYASPSVVDFFTVRNLDFLCHFVLQVADHECVRLVKDGKEVPGDPDSCQT